MPVTDFIGIARETPAVMKFVVAISMVVVVVKALQVHASRLTVRNRWPSTAASHQQPEEDFPGSTTTSRHFVCLHVGVSEKVRPPLYCPKTLWS